MKTANTILAFFAFVAISIAANGQNNKNVNYSDDSSDFVMLAEAVPDVILEPRYYSTYNFVGARIDGYEEPCMLYHRTAADSLRAVAADLAKMGYRLKVWDAYRPQCAVDHFVRWAKNVNDTIMRPYFYPTTDRSRLFEDGYIDYLSGHTRGSAIDLTLFDMTTGKDVDMGGLFDHFGIESHPDYMGITTEQYRNRMTLRNAMLRHGFKPILTEWWHFVLAKEPCPNTYFTFPVKRLDR